MPPDFTHYIVVLKVLSPLHIGKRKYRNLMTTREYVPGRTLWGALTARITRDFTNDKDYVIIGDVLQENLRLGYLWPATKNHDNSQKYRVYFPWESQRANLPSLQITSDSEFEPVFLNPVEFDHLFKFGYMGQPTDPIRKATSEGMLFEVEYIAPKTRDNQDVYLAGDLWVKDRDKPFAELINQQIKSSVSTNQSLIFIQVLENAFNSLQLGGEKGYGWGRVMLEKLETGGDQTLNGTHFDADNSKVILDFQEGSHLPAHILAAEWKGESLKPAAPDSISGPIEVLTGYGYWRKGDDTRNKKFGLINPPICYSPGGKVLTNLELVVGKFGILGKV